MKPIFYTLSCILLLVSCKPAGSKEDRQAAKEIANFWGGKCSYSTTASFSTKKGKRKIFNLKLSGSPAFNTKVPPVVIASNMAWTAYSKWTPDEKEKYTEIDARLQKTGKEKEELNYEYTIQQLKTVNSKLPFLNTCVTELKEHKLAELFHHIDPSLYTDSSITDFTKTTAQFDSAYGRLNDYKLVGFSFSEGAVKGRKIPVIVLYVTLIYTKDKLQFSFYADNRKEINETFLYGLRFEF